MTPLEQQYVFVDDEKLRMSLVTLADRYSNKTRNIIYRCYNDLKINEEYRMLRSKNDLSPYAKTHANHREVLRFPNSAVSDFCNTVMTSLYGTDWMNDLHALNHELVRPWWVVSDLKKVYTKFK